MIFGEREGNKIIDTVGVCDVRTWSLIRCSVCRMEVETDDGGDYDGGGAVFSCPGEW